MNRGACSLKKQWERAAIGPFQAVLLIFSAQLCKGTRGRLKGQGDKAMGEMPSMDVQ